MRYLLIPFLCLIALNSIAQNTTIDGALQKPYLPKEVKDLYVGIPKADAMKLHKAMAVTKKSLFGYPDEIFKTGDVKMISYQLTGDSIVSEFIIEYRSEAKAIAIAKKMYKNTNDPSTGFQYSWLFPLKDGLILKIWIYKNKICITETRLF